ncbi:MAG: hypothetical protein ACP5D2_01330 [Candidatus Nanoarchaeia archaeon]
MKKLQALALVTALGMNTPLECVSRETGRLFKEAYTNAKAYVINSLENINDYSR